MPSYTPAAGQYNTRQLFYYDYLPIIFFVEKLLRTINLKKLKIVVLNRFILQKFVDPMLNINFADYDNGHYNSGTEEWVFFPDGIVEMAIIR